MFTEAVIANKAYAKFSTPAECDIDTIALNVIKQDCPDFLLPIKTMEINGCLEIRYELTDGVRLRYVPPEMMKKDFTALLINLLTPFKTCGDWFLCRNNFYLDLDYIIVGKDGPSVKYVYLPAAEYASSDEEIVEFFFKLILSKTLSDDEAYMVELIRIFKNNSRNKLMEVLDFLLNKSQPSDDQAPAVFPPMPENESQQMPNSQRPGTNPAPTEQPPSRKPADDKPPVIVPDKPKNVKPEIKPVKEPDDDEMKKRIIGGLYGVDGDPVDPNAKDRRGRWPRINRKKKTPPQPQEQPPQFGQPQMPMQMQQGGQKGGFVPPQGQPPFPQQQFVPPQPGSYYQPSDLTDIDEETVHDSSILRLRLIENTMLNCPKYIEIPLTGGFATVGRFDKSGQPRSNYNFDASLSFVSHMHFRVEQNGSAWTIIDLNSSNGTFVNSQKLVPNVKYPLAVGDTIMISTQYRMTYVVS